MNDPACEALTQRLNCLTRSNRRLRRILVESIAGALALASLLSPRVALAEAQHPALSGLSSDERLAVDLACISAKVEGPAPWNRCVKTQLDALRAAPGRPDLSGLSSDERVSLELACLAAKIDGPASWRRCLHSQLEVLRRVERAPTAPEPRLPSTQGMLPSVTPFPQARHLQAPSLTIESLMPRADFRASGLEKLTTEESRNLNRWLTQYSLSLLGLRDTSPTGDVIESRIDGTFNGWGGDTIFKLENGQIWQQASYAYKYHYAYRPEVLIYRSGGRHRMKVEGVDESIEVRRLK